MLERSIEQDGWIGALTVAADGESFDGSARLEVAADKFADAEPIVVESDGTRPVVVKRVDIPNAEDERAVRLGIAANRVAQVNLEFDPVVLGEIGAEIDLGEMFKPDELEELALAVDGGVGENGSWALGKGGRPETIAVIIAVDDAGTVESALRKVGGKSRGEALIALCKRVIGDAGQFDVHS